MNLFPIIQFGLKYVPIVGTKMKANSRFVPVAKDFPIVQGNVNRSIGRLGIKWTVNAIG